uniref:Large ribosomal subunit protein mL49 n=1 Tax=Gadus morhua TaxID=8049 RepID=A0A8C5FQY7_GADMO
MSACFTLRFKMIHRVLRCAFQLPGPSVIRLQPMCVAVGEQNPPCGTLETTKEYMFVERLIPPTRVPVPPRHDGPAPSGWAPPSDVPPSLPYMVRRSRMHNIPVYTDISHGNRRPPCCAEWRGTSGHHGGLKGPECWTMPTFRLMLTTANLFI